MCDCLISFEWRVYVVQPYVSLGDNSNSVCGCWWVIGWVCMGACRGGDSRKSRFNLVGCMFDYIIVSEVAETGGPFVFVCLLH